MLESLFNIFISQYYGYGEIKKLLNNTLGLESNKIKIPKKNSPFGFVCFKNDEGLLKPSLHVLLINKILPLL